MSRMLQDVRTGGGIALGFYVTSSSSAQALCTTLGYRQIKRVVEQQRLVMRKKVPHKNVRSTPDRHSTASECLTTFMIIALTLYCPLAIVYCFLVVESIFGVIDPVTVTLIVIVANSGGWANALGYFHNLKIKAARERHVKADHLLSMVTASTSGCSSAAP